MPYIKKKDRQKLVAGVIPTTPGELAYKLTLELRAYVDLRPGFQALAEVLGALEATKLEFYRRVGAPYEDSKIQENGDVY